MTKKTGEIVMLYTNYKKTQYKDFTQFVRNGQKLVFWQGGEFLEDPENGEYIRRQNNKITILLRA